MKTLLLPLVIFVSTAAGAGAVAVRTNIPYADAKPILDAIREDLLPVEFQGKTRDQIESAWPRWVSERDAQIRRRLERGDQDSIANFLLFGVTFTNQPRMRTRDILALASQARSSELLQDRILQRRLEDMVAGIVSPGVNERLQFVRRIMEARGIDPRTPAGKSEVRRYLDEGLQRLLAEYEAYSRAPAQERSVRFDERGLSSDTSIFPNFAIDRALEALKSEGLLGSGSVRRVGILGPGLDFTDKREGYDFYPQQTLQPFAVMDSLIRLGLARRDDLRTTTFDLSPRINQHLEVARQRARANGAYVLQLPRDTNSRWNQDLAAYWERLGDTIGEETKALEAPLGLGSVRVRAVRIPPEVVLTIDPQDLDIVLQRLEPLPPGPADERFDVIIATNLLIYYEVFEQSLALANVARMLRPGGFFLTNTPPVILPTMPMDSVGFIEAVYSSQLNDRDRIVWYQRR